MTTSVQYTGKSTVLASQHLKLAGNRLRYYNHNI